jgi:hypothetical protein
MYACREQYPGANQQNIANYFSLLWGKPISRCCIGDILSENENPKLPPPLLLRQYWWLKEYGCLALLLQLQRLYSVDSDWKMIMKCQ